MSDNGLNSFQRFIFYLILQVTAILLIINLIRAEALNNEITANLEELELIEGGSTFVVNPIIKRSVNSVPIPTRRQVRSLKRHLNGFLVRFLSNQF